MRIEIKTKSTRKRLSIDFITLEKDGKDFSLDCNGESQFENGTCLWKGVDINYAYGDEDPIDANGKLDVIKNAIIVDIQAYDYDTSEELFNLIPIISIDIEDGNDKYSFPKSAFADYNKYVRMAHSP